MNLEGLYSHVRPLKSLHVKKYAATFGRGRLKKRALAHYGGAPTSCVAGAQGARAAAAGAPASSRAPTATAAARWAVRCDQLLRALRGRYLDNDTSSHVLKLETYGGKDDDEGSWVLLVADTLGGYLADTKHPYWPGIYICVTMCPLPAHDFTPPSPPKK